MGTICRTAILGLLALAFIATSGCERKESSPVVARIDDKVLTIQELREMVPGWADPKHAKSAVDDWIDDQILYKEAVREGIDREKTVRRLIESSKMDIVINELLEREMRAAGDITEDMIRKYYENHEEMFTRDEVEIKARHILVDTKTEARKMRSRVISGEDFAKIAEEESLDISSQSGGDLGYFSEGMVDRSFWRAVIDMKPKTISYPIKTELGYHIVEIVEKKQPGTLKELDEVRDEIIAEVYAERQKEAVARLLAELKSESNIELNKDLIDEEYKK